MRKPPVLILIYLAFEAALSLVYLALVDCLGKESAIVGAASALFLLLTILAGAWTGSRCYAYFKNGEQSQ
jgi:hypothetical protein